jgi:NADPH-dependent glutamate synthase beta subunit-like oxidoreductase
VSIGRLERFVADHGPAPHVEHTSAEGAAISVAVVGSGPAGCATAWYLLAAGARVTMVEQSDEIGGVLRWGIPSFTLPESVVEQPLKALEAAGLTVRSGTRVGVDVEIPELLAEYDAVVLAHGASRPLSVSVPGIDLPGVEDATTFLVRAKKALNAGNGLSGFRFGSRVLVIGGGNTAMDVARTARRLGVDVVAIEWMNERFARVRPDELTEARAEGVDVRFTTTLERLEGDGAGVRTAWLRRTRQNKIKQRPRVLRGAAEAITVDHVIVALGYRVDASVTGELVSLPLRPVDQTGAIPDRRWTASGIPTGPSFAVGTQALQREVGLAVAASPVHGGWWRRIQSSPAASSVRFRATWWARMWRRQAEIGMAAAPTPRADRLWVVGDALVGPSTVSGAMAQGREAARAILATRPQA